VSAAEVSSLRARPVALNTAIAYLFMVGSACFVLGSVPGYLQTVGGSVDGITFFVGSLFFTSASFGQLLQAQSPAMSEVDERRQRVRAPVRVWAWLPHDRNWLAAVTQFPGTIFFNISTFAALAHNLSAAEQDQHVWRPDAYGSVLFLVASGFALLALDGGALRWRGSSLPWRIAWVNMSGSVLFMVSALASYVLPSGGDLADGIAVAGTLLGAAFFFWGAALMLPAWKRAVQQSHHEAATEGEMT